MKTKFAVLAFMIVMMSAVQAAEIIKPVLSIAAQTTDYPEPRGLR